MQDVVQYSSVFARCYSAIAGECSGPTLLRVVEYSILAYQQYQQQGGQCRCTCSSSLEYTLPKPSSGCGKVTSACKPVGGIEVGGDGTLGCSGNTNGERSGDFGVVVAGSQVVRYRGPNFERNRRWRLAQRASRLRKFGSKDSSTEGDSESESVVAVPVVAGLKSRANTRVTVESLPLELTAEVQRSFAERRVLENKVRIAQLEQRLSGGVFPREVVKAGVDGVLQERGVGRREVKAVVAAAKVEPPQGMLEVRSSLAAVNARLRTMAERVDAVVAGVTELRSEARMAVTSGLRSRGPWD